MTVAPRPGVSDPLGPGAIGFDPAQADPAPADPAPARPDGSAGGGPREPAPPTSAAAVEELLGRLRETVEHARSLPMSSSVVVHRGEVLDLVAAARAALPVELDRAQGVVARADEVLEQARRDGRAELERARAAAEELVSEQAVVTAARSRADTLLAEARAEAARLLREADDYCDRRLADFEIDLDRITQQVRRGRDKLRERAQAASSADQDPPAVAEPAGTGAADGTGVGTGVGTGDGTGVGTGVGATGEAADAAGAADAADGDRRPPGSA